MIGGRWGATHLFLTMIYNELTEKQIKKCVKLFKEEISEEENTLDRLLKIKSVTEDKKEQEFLFNLNKAFWKLKTKKKIIKETQIKALELYTLYIDK